jgi:hypothetical protein
LGYWEREREVEGREVGLQEAHLEAHAEVAACQDPSDFALVVLLLELCLGLALVFVFPKITTACCWSLAPCWAPHVHHHFLPDFLVHNELMNRCSHPTGCSPFACFGFGSGTVIEEGEGVGVEGLSGHDHAHAHAHGREKEKKKEKEKDYEYGAVGS